MLFTPRDCIYTSKITKRCSSVEIILIKMKCPYRELFKFPKITIQKSHSLLVEGTRTVLTSRLANKTMSHYTIVKSIRNTTCIFFRLSALELCCDASDRQVCRRTGVQTGRCTDGQVCRRTGVQMDRCADRQANSCLFSAAASVLTPFFCAILTHIITSFSCDFCFNAVRKTT